MDAIDGIVESFGNCKNCRYCRGFNQTLGNELCEACGDNGGRPKGGKYRKGGTYQNRRRKVTKDEKIIDEYLKRTRVPKRVATNTYIY